MALYERLLGINLADPNLKIPVHVWPKLYEQYDRSRVTLTTMIDAYSLSDKSQAIVQVFPGADKLGLSVGHTWVNDDGVYITTTGTAPGGLAVDDLYFVVNSNPTEGSVQLANSKGGAVINITSEGTGTHTLNRLEEDVVHWGETRIGITSVDGNSDQQLRRIVWDEKAEGLLEVAEVEIDHNTVAAIKTELEQVANWLTKS